MGLSERGYRSRACVLGLDGVPFELARRLASEGIMPALRDVFASAGPRPMVASLPPVSQVCWSSFMTGKDPGHHGVFGFTELEPNSYRVRFPSFEALRAPTLWDQLGRLGKRSIVINQPATYPARPIRGVLISGFVTVDFERAVFPPSKIPRLRKLGYVTDIDATRARDDKEFLFRSLQHSLEAQRRAAEWLWSSEDWDYLEFVITGTDRLHHFAWSALEQLNHPYRQVALEYYRRVDRLIGQFYDRFERLSRGQPPGVFCLLSDHGFAAARHEVQLNAWLKEAGYLGFQSRESESLAEITADSRAFALDPGRVYIHREGFYPLGGVNEVEADRLREHLREQIMGIRLGDEPVVQEIFRGREIYSGPAAAGGPDLVVVAADGFDLKAGVGADAIIRPASLEGMHTWRNAFFWSTFDTPEDELKITDVAGKILARIGPQSAAE